MLTTLFPQEMQDNALVPKEGELYKVINLHGHTFPLYYGYYEACERENPAVEPMPIYPDFLKEPRYTSEGFAFVTKMQDSCKHYKGKPGVFNECAECQHYLNGEELLGICTCSKNKLPSLQECDRSV